VKEKVAFGRFLSGRAFTTRFFCKNKKELKQAVQSLTQLTYKQKLKTEIIFFYQKTLFNIICIEKPITIDEQTKIQSLFVTLKKC
jgi:hypothetical protein